VECLVLDGERVAGSAFVEIQVVFKGRVPDVGPVATPVAGLPASAIFRHDMRLAAFDR
jgi:hypothetical protein